MVRDNTILNGSERSGPTSIEEQTCVCSSDGFVLRGCQTTRSPDPPLSTAALTPLLQPPWLDIDLCIHYSLLCACVCVWERGPGEVSIRTTVACSFGVTVKSKLGYRPFCASEWTGSESNTMNVCYRRNHTLFNSDFNHSDLKLMSDEKERKGWILLRPEWAAWSENTFTGSLWCS